MRFQRILLPTVCTCNELYFNGNFRCTNEELYLDSENTISSDTYFNSISLKKLLKYTNISSITLHFELYGKCKLFACAAWIDECNIIRREDNKFIEIGNSNSFTKFDIPFKLKDHFEILYFKIVAIDDCILKSMYYDSNVVKNKIKLAIGICTYKREDYIKRNLSLLNESELFSDENSRPDIYICDNARTLPDINYPYVSIIPNRNVGGSGGFTRCMMEIKKSNKNYTHFILMDDDISLDPHIIERNLDLLHILRKEHLDGVIGGAMFTLHEPWRQFETGGLYRHGLMEFPNKNRDMRQIRSILVNCQETRLNYNAWCYCCMPTTVFNKGLPLPIFIHMDDIEYGTRLCREIITINGICVWHPFYNNQRPSSIVYYDVRNKLIVLSRENKNDIVKYAINMLNGFLPFVFKYDYGRFLAACDGFEAYLAGINTFKSSDPVKINENLKKYKVDWRDIPVDTKYTISRVPEFKMPHNKKECINTIMLKTDETPIYLDCDISQANPNNHRTMVLINPITNTYATFHKNSLLCLKCLFKYCKIKKMIRSKGLVISKEWHNRYGELTTDEFWSDYLKMGE